LNRVYQLTRISEIRNFAIVSKHRHSPAQYHAEQIRPRIAIRQDYVIGRKMTTEQQDVEVVLPAASGK
jgi:hypothetical protein